MFSLPDWWSKPRYCPRQFRNLGIRYKLRAQLVSRVYPCILFLTPLTRLCRCRASGTREHTVPIRRPISDRCNRQSALAGLFPTAQTCDCIQRSSARSNVELSSALYLGTMSKEKRDLPPAHPPDGDNECSAFVFSLSRCPDRSTSARAIQTSLNHFIPELFCTPPHGHPIKVLGAFSLWSENSARHESQKDSHSAFMRRDCRILTEAHRRGMQQHIILSVPEQGSRPALSGRGASVYRR